MNRNRGIIWRMFKVWLLIRALDFQQQHETDSEEAEMASALLGIGKRKYVETANFAGACTKLNLYFFLLPKWVRNLIRKQPPIVYAGTTPIRSGLSNIYFLIDDAEDKDFISYAHKEENDNEKDKTLVRVTPKGRRFMTYPGYIEELLSRYPRAWAFVFLPLLIGIFGSPYLKEFWVHLVEWL